MCVCVRLQNVNMISSCPTGSNAYPNHHKDHTQIHTHAHTDGEAICSTRHKLTREHTCRPTKCMCVRVCVCHTVQVNTVKHRVISSLSPGGLTLWKRQHINC